MRARTPCKRENIYSKRESVIRKANALDLVCMQLSVVELHVRVKSSS